MGVEAPIAILLGSLRVLMHFQEQDSKISKTLKVGLAVRF